MEPIVVRYKIKPDSTGENTRLIEAVFAELQTKAPEGVRYAVLRLEDGSFVHIAHQAEGATPIPALQAFGAFSAGMAERCIDPPVVCDATVVGNYRMLR
jgi:hypothetical protein